MDGRQPEDRNDPHDDEIIDLNEVVEKGSDNDIIDLTDILDQPDQAPVQAEDADEDVIPLVDAVPAEDAVDAPQAADDDIIDLTDMAASPDAPSARDIGEIDLPSEIDESEEEVIDLLDIAKTLESDISESDGSVPGARPAEPSEASDAGGEIIELMDVSPVQEAETAEAEEEEIIALTNMTAVQEAESSESEAPPEPPDRTAAETGDVEDEEIIELTDTVRPEAAASDAAADAGPTPVARDDDDIIDLTAPVTTEPVDDEAAVGPFAEFSDLESRAETMLRDTTYRFDYDPEIEAAETAGPDADFGLLATEPSLEPDEATHEPVDLDQPDGEPAFIPVPPSEAPSTGEGIVLTEQQLQAALTTAIENIYGDRIEQLLLRTIEKTVRREIAKIKNALLEDEDDMIG
ncbi:MAG TPA: hypothetical protein VLT88_07535 [Desulfosarcina sp.]|nr:hypothetical protein [Desulfosarcina sp.]